MGSLVSLSVVLERPMLLNGSAQLRGEDGFCDPPPKMILILLNTLHFHEVDFQEVDFTSLYWPENGVCPGPGFMHAVF